MKPGLKILFLAAEAAPIIKVGGLGDVAGSLPQALLDLPDSFRGSEPIDIRLVLPFHAAIDRNEFDFTPVAAFTIAHRDGPIPAQIYETKVGSLTVYLVSGPPLSPQGPIYTVDPGIDALKYVFVSLAALEMCKILDWSPDILHANDWHTAAAVYALYLKRKHISFWENTASLITVHNLPYLGLGAETVLTQYGLPPDPTDSLPDWAKQAPLPLGLLSADQITTVSPGYAKEILTEEFGSGLFDFLATRKGHITGILNGLDQQSWDPATDPVILTNYSNRSLKLRVENKTDLQNVIDLPLNPMIPLLSMVTRMDNQKGVDIALEALYELKDVSWQAVLLGTGDPLIEEKCKALQQDFADRVRVINEFSADLARKIYAGADMILVPSRYEPCGLTQMIGMRYGCVPVVRSVGGLRDTVENFDPEKGTGTGFGYHEENSQTLSGTIRNAIQVYGDQRRWRGIQLRGMALDFSWEKSAESYYELYQQLHLQHSGL